MKTGERAFAGPQLRGGNLGVPRNLDRLNRRDHRPLDGLGLPGMGIAPKGHSDQPYVVLLVVAFAS